MAARLVERTPRLVKLTAAGAEFLERARDLLAAHDRALAGAISTSAQTAFACAGKRAMPIRCGRMVGLLPEELQEYVIYTGGVSVAAKQTDAAKALIKHLTSLTAAEVLKSQGLDPATH